MRRHHVRPIRGLSSDVDLDGEQQIERDDPPRYGDGMPRRHERHEHGRQTELRVGVHQHRPDVHAR